MKYSLDCYIKTGNLGIRNAVKQLIPDENDPRIWDAQHIKKDIIAEDEIPVFVCMVRFHAKSDRAGVVASIKGLSGIIHACEISSFVRELKTWHDEDINNPPRHCEIESIMEKT
jgi:hypothetical protein